MLLATGLHAGQDCSRFLSFPRGLWFVRTFSPPTRLACSVRHARRGRSVWGYRSQIPASEQCPPGVKDDPRQAIGREGRGTGRVRPMSLQRRCSELVSFPAGRTTPLAGRHARKRDGLTLGRPRKRTLRPAALFFGNNEIKPRLTAPFIVESGTSDRARKPCLSLCFVRITQDPFGKPSRIHT